jgi:general secretion pathway protein D
MVIQRRWRNVLQLAVVTSLLVACATDPLLEQSRRDFANGDRVAALLQLEQAVKGAPGNVELRSYYIRQRDEWLQEKLTLAESARAAGRLDEARAHYVEALSIDSVNPRARLGLEELQRLGRRIERLEQARVALGAGDDSTATRLVRGLLAEAPGSEPARTLLRELENRTERARAPQAETLQGAMAKPVTLEFRDAQLRIVFEALARASGLNFVFDQNVRADSRVTLFVRDNSVDEVLNLLTATQGIERKLLNANSVLIYPATAAKQREHVDLVTRSFFLANTDAKSAQTMLKQLVKSRDIFIDEKLNLLVMKDTPAAVRLAEKLISTLDVAEPEVMLELEVLEVSRSKLLDLGFEFPNQIGYGLLTPSIAGASQIVNGVTISGTTQLGGKLLDGNVNLRDTDGLVPFVSNPAAVLRLRSEDGDSSLLANPRIRVRNREKAKIHIGDKLPVFTTTSTANVGVSASVTYLDVGLKLEVEPSVYRDDEVGIKLNLEVSSIVREVPGPASSLAYQVGTRSASTSLRLRNGETQVLAGLINDEDRSAGRRFPGLGDLPIVGRLFSAQRDSTNKTEIALLITPRILRNVLPPVALLADTDAGTEANVGAEPLRLRSTEPGSLGLVGATSVAREPAQGIRSEVVAPRVDTGKPSPPEQSAIIVPELELNVPKLISRGDPITVSIGFGALGSAGSGEVTLVYDSSRLEAEGATVPGVIKLPLIISEGKASVEVSLRSKPDAAGNATLVVTGLNLNQDGEDRAIPLSVGATLQIVN